MISKHNLYTIFSNFLHSDTHINGVKKLWVQLNYCLTITSTDEYNHILYKKRIWEEDFQLSFRDLWVPSQILSVPGFKYSHQLYLLIYFFIFVIFFLPAATIYKLPVFWEVLGSIGVRTRGTTSCWFSATQPEEGYLVLLVM